MTHTKYWPRSRSGSTQQEPEDEEIHDCKIASEHVLGQSQGSALPSSRDSHLLKIEKSGR